MPQSLARLELIPSLALSHLFVCFSLREYRIKSDFIGVIVS